MARPAPVATSYKNPHEALTPAALVAKPDLERVGNQRTKEISSWNSKIPPSTPLPSQNKAQIIEPYLGLVLGGGWYKRACLRIP